MPRVPCSTKSLRTVGISRVARTTAWQPVPSIASTVTVSSGRPARRSGCDSADTSV